MKLPHRGDGPKNSSKVNEELELQTSKKSVFFTLAEIQNK
jgi:hypothetical protein